MAEVHRVREERFGRMTPDELLTLSERLAGEVVADFMSVHGLDRASAVSALRRFQNAGRRPSACMNHDRDI